MRRRAPGAIALPRQMKQGVFQKKAAGKDGRAGGLRQDQDILVLEQSPEIPWSVGLLPGKAMVDQQVAASQPVVRRCRPAVEQDLPSFDTLPPPFLRRVGVIDGI